MLPDLSSGHALVRPAPRLLFVPRVGRTTTPRARLFAEPPVGEDWSCLVVRAPGGYGKSTAVAQLVRDARFADHQVVWLAVDAGSSSAAFWSELTGALRLAGLPLRPVLIEEVSGRQPGGWLVREIAAAVAQHPAPLLLVIDDLHTADDGEPERLLAQLGAVCTNLRMIVTGRTFGYLTSTVAAAQLDIAVIDERTLAFTTDEVHDLLRRTAGADVPRERAERLREAIGGWPLGLRLLAADASDGGARLDDLAVLADKVTRRLGADEARLLMQLAVPDTLTIDLVVRLGVPTRAGARRRLGRLVSDGLAVARTHDQRTVFRLHSLVRDALRERYRRRHPEAFLQATRTTIAHLLHVRSPRTAFEMAAEADLWGEANEIAEREGMALFADRTWLRTTLRSAPATALARHPLLAAFAAMTSEQRGRSSLDSLSVALRAAMSASGRTAVAARPLDRIWRGALIVLAQPAFGHETDLRALNEVLRGVEALRPVERMRARGAIVLLQRVAGWTCLYAGSHERARRLLRAAADGLGASDHAWGRAASLGHLALSYALRGDPDGTRRNAAAAAELVDASAWREVSLLVDIEIAHGLVELDALDPGRARAAAEALPRAHPDMLQVSLAHYLAYEAALMDDRPEERLRALERTPRERVSPWGHLRALASAAEADLALSLGRFSRVDAILREHDAPALLPARARSAYFRGQLREAVHLAARALVSDDPRLRADGLIIDVMALLTLRRPERARRHARELSQLIAITGLHGRLARVPGHLREEFAALLDLDDPVAGTLRSDRLPDPFGTMRAAAPLSPREHAILRLLARGLTLAQCAAELGTSVNTVKRQTASIYRKLGVSSREDALDAALAAGLLGEE